MSDLAKRLLEPKEYRDKNGKLEYFELRFSDSREHLVVYDEPTESDLVLCRRAIACWNACAAFTIEQLEDKALMLILAMNPDAIGQ